MLQCKNSKGDGPAIPPVVYRELVAAAAPTTSSYVVVLPVCARQWLAVEAPAAVRCAASANAFRRVLSSCSACTYMYPGHFVPLAVGNAHVRIVGSWRYLAANLDVQYCSPTPGLLSRPTYRIVGTCSCPRKPLCILSCLSPHVARYTCCCSHSARGTLQDHSTQKLAAEATSSMHPPPSLTSPNRETRRRLACSCFFLPSRAEASRLPSGGPAPDQHCTSFPRCRASVA